MELQLTRDGSQRNKKIVMEFSGGAFAPNANVRINSAHNRSFSIAKTKQIIDSKSEIDAIDMMNTDQLIGSMTECRAREDYSSL